jgi:3-deoxy-D-manno-octulosonic-acid transferase
MLFIYRIFINTVFIILPIIIIVRLFKRKEDYRSIKEKIGFNSKKRGMGSLIWFHGASVGEIKSIIPLILKLEKQNNIKKILITSNTLSSADVFNNFKLKKTIHQFFPIDTNFITKKFIEYWSPSKVFFIDSEIWPNMILNIKKKKIPLILINGRITKKTFRRWNRFKNFSKEIFSNFDLCLTSDKVSKNYLTKLKAKNIIYIGNLKFTETKNKKINLSKNLDNFLNLKNSWCASSTHHNEEIICGKIHLKIRKKLKNLLTIIIPRHIERSEKIKIELEKLGLKVFLHSNQKKIDFDTDIYLVNAYDKTKFFFNKCKNVFLGGSLINHGGQNPLEAARYDCNILHGPNIKNFNEIYQFLKEKNASYQVKNINEFCKILSKLLSSKKPYKKIKTDINILGENILNKTLKKINAV